MNKQNFSAFAMTALSAGFVLAGCSGDLTSDAESENTKDDANLAVAVSCTGAGCDGKDPVNSGCAASAVNIDSQVSSKGTFYLRYSRTCKTNWVHVGNYAGGSSASNGKLELSVDEETRGKFVPFFASPTPGTHYGNMVYSPGNSCARGFAAWNDGEYDVRNLESSGCAALTANGTSMR